MKRMKLLTLCGVSSLMLLTACGSKTEDAAYETLAEITSEVQEDTVMETETETEPQTERETEIETEAETEPQAETETEVETETQTETETEAETETEIQTETETEAETTTEENYVPGSNQSDAVLVPLGTKVFGTVKEDSNVWFAFTTDDTLNATYNITFVNATADGRPLEGRVFDEYGTELGRNTADTNGTPATISMIELIPNTTYYIRINPNNNNQGTTSEYSVVVKNPDSESTAYKTVGTFSDARGSADTIEGNIFSGTNLNDAVFLPLETKVSGSVKEDSNAWFAFTTDDTLNATYNITFVNATADGRPLEGRVFDEYGTELGRNTADTNGTPATISMIELIPNTTYYIRINPNNNNQGTTSDYTLVVKSPEVKVEEETPLVFEVPFEINETQVQFVINEAAFIDEAKAKEVLKPVAEAILKYPEHSVLIAGTTATDGTQESCVDLANRRAEAVKKLLIDTYNVPEAQLVTVGLGYALDPFERGKDIDANGKFVESEAKKNRRVVILDINDPVAQELIKNTN